MSRVAYSATKDVFIDDVKWNRFIPKMREGARLNHIGSGYSEISSWKSNAPSVRNLLELSQIPNDVIVSFEYKVPNGGRIDCMLYGEGNNGLKNIVKGGPGTGKTVIALHVLAQMAQEGKASNMYFTTRSKALRESLRERLQNISLQDGNKLNASDLISNIFHFKPHYYEESEVELEPLNSNYEVIELDLEREFKTIGIFKCVLSSEQ